jgi:hypothetical protein
VDTSGTSINGAALKEAIRRGQIVTVHRGTDGTHPTLVVEQVENPADAGSSLTLDALKDVTAPANTPAGKMLGTTAAGEWGPVASPIRSSRPNGADRLVEVWDGTAWVRTHYDTGWRDCAALLHADLTPLEGLKLRRVGAVVYAQCGVAVPTGWTAGTAMATLPAGFTPNVMDLYLPMSYQSTGSNSILFANGNWGLYANAAVNYKSNFAWPTNDPIPSSLPGIPFGATAD